MTDLFSINRLLVDCHDPNRTIAILQGKIIPWTLFRQRAAAYAQFFLKHQCQHWALYFEDSFEFTCALFGAWHADKHISLPADALPETIEKLKRSQHALAGNFVQADLPNHTLLPDANFQFTELRSDCLITIFTSGSNGDPSAVCKQLRQLTQEVKTLATQWQSLPSRIPVLATVSHQHIYGLLFKILWPLACGRPFISERLAFPEQILNQLTHSSAVLVSSPAHLKRLPQHLAWHSVSSNLKAVFSSGGPLPQQAVETCANLFTQAPWEIYGSSETGGIAYRNRFINRTQRWQALPKVNIRVSSQGHLEVKSPHLPSAHEWFSTQDLVRLEVDGFELLGRSDRIVKLEEKRISLTQLEKILESTGWFQEVRALILGESRAKIAIATVPTTLGWQILNVQGRLAFNQQLRDLLKPFIPNEAIPRQWRHLWRFPQNSQGKLTDCMLSVWFKEAAPVFQVIEKLDSQSLIQLDAPANSPYFDGHFANHPILPGVAQIEWSVRIAELLFPISGYFCGLHGLKFQQPITPNTSLQLLLVQNREKNHITFTLSSAQGQHASGRIAFTEEMPCELVQ